jgi:hypothetical protein
MSKIDAAIERAERLYGEIHKCPTRVHEMQIPGPYEDIVDAIAEAVPEMGLTVTVRPQEVISPAGERMPGAAVFLFANPFQSMSTMAADRLVFRLAMYIVSVIPAVGALMVISDGDTRVFVRGQDEEEQ